MNQSILLSAFCTMVVFSASSFATWQMASPERTAVITSSDGNMTIPKGLLAHPAYSVHLQKDWLYKNVVRIAKQYGWGVRWKASYQDWVLNSVEVGGPSFESMMNQIVQNYPSLRAIYDPQNKTVTITPVKKGK